ncbi:MAG: glycosyltransferase family 2 protein [Spirochaetaceae bacterium]|nr:glycosyltransferase family 2 protein [Spirochaetaceae bacterium]
MTRLCVVILNYRTSAMTLDCIRTLTGQLNPSRDRVVVVDNASGGDEAALLRSGIREQGIDGWATVVVSPTNGGFSAGNNIGVRFVNAPLYLLTNSDTLFRAGAIERMLEAVEQYPRAGIIGPRLEWPDGTPQISCFKFPSPMSELIGAAGTGVVTRLLARYNVPLPVVDRDSVAPWTSFACVLIRRAVFEHIGPMDEGYFMYFEDVDLCRRARNAGYDVLNFPSARVVHLQGQSSGREERALRRQRLPVYYYHSRSWYYRKFHGYVGLVASNVFWLLGRCISLLREVLFGKDQTVVSHQHLDIWKSKKYTRRMDTEA